MTTYTTTVFGQLVIGPPGSGKSTYCDAMCDFLKALGRNVAVINLDPANDVFSYEASIDVSKLIRVEDVMENMNLGPNGGLVYCMEYLEANFNWLLEELKKFNDCYLLFDCPGQVELFTDHSCIHNIVSKLQKADINLTAVHLVDSHYCSDPGKFISVLFTSLAAMMRMEMPHINVLSKGDTIEKYGKLQFNIDFFTEVLDLSLLIQQLSDDPFLSKYKKLNEALADTIENYSLVSFVPLSVKSKDSMLKVLQLADKANGYCFGVNEERNIGNMLSTAMSADLEYGKTAEIREKYMDLDASDNKVEGYISEGR